MRIAIIGGSVAGLSGALFLARAGHEVVVLERDAMPLPATPLEAFESWDRRGAPQVRHSHAFLARLRNLLRDRAPDLLAALLAAGAEELRYADLLPPTMADRAPRPGDDDLVMLACRRLTFEWVLRKLALGEPRIRFRDGAEVVALRSAGAAAGVPRVDGVVVRGPGGAQREPAGGLGRRRVGAALAPPRVARGGGAPRRRARKRRTAASTTARASTGCGAARGPSARPRSAPTSAT